MATRETITIEKGRTGNIILGVSDLPDSEELIAKFFATSVVGGTPEIVITGVISSDLEEIDFAYNHNTTKNLTVKRLYYEVVVYLEDKSFIKNISSGLLHIAKTVKTDPTI
jgi:hypothetical protein